MATKENCLSLLMTPLKTWAPLKQLLVKNILHGKTLIIVAYAKLPTTRIDLQTYSVFLENEKLCHNK